MQFDSFDMTDRFQRHYNYFKKLQVIFNKEFIESKEKFLGTEEGMQRVDDFYNFVLPSLVSHRLSEKFLCFFPDCIHRSFATRQSLVRHLLSLHPYQIPGRGLFLTSCSSIIPDQFSCHKCRLIFSRRDHFNTHLNTHLHDLELNTVNEDSDKENSPPLAIKYTEEWHLEADLRNNEGWSTTEELSLPSYSDTDSEDIFTHNSKTLKRDLSSLSIHGYSKKSK